MRSRPRRFTAARLCTVLCAVSLFLAGCAGFPRSSAVQQYDPSPREISGVGLRAHGPVPGASPEDIVQGFLLAMRAGSTDDFSGARQFLAESAARQWDPLRQITIYPDSQTPNISRTESGAVRVSVGPIGTVSKEGRYTDAGSDSSDEIEFSLVRNADNQWRILKLSDGILLPESVFVSTYTRAPLYFYSGDGKSLVADIRWFPTHSVVTSITKALLAGPSAWLKEAVLTSAPNGTALADNNVVIDNGVATVNLNANVLSASEEDRTRLREQLRASLAATGSVTSVRLLVNSDPLISDDTAEQTIVPTYPYGTYPVHALADGKIDVVNDGKLQAAVRGDFASFELSNLAVSYDTVPFFAAISHKRNVVVIHPNGSMVTIANFNQPVPPSIDRSGWVWTADAESGQLLAYIDSSKANAVGQRLNDVKIPVPWLAGEKIDEIRVSRDSSRIAVISHKGGDLLVQIAAITRDANNFPVSIGDPIVIGERLSEAHSLSWISDSEVAVLGRSVTGGTETNAFILPLGGSMTSVRAAENAATLTGGRGLRSLIIGTNAGTIFERVGAAWRVLATGGVFPALPG